MTERLGKIRPPFSFNSDVRASIQPLNAYEEQVIYAAYNSTNDRGNCSKSQFIIMTYSVHTCIATCKGFQSEQEISFAHGVRSRNTTGTIATSQARVYNYHVMASYQYNMNQLIIMSVSSPQ